jgi:hypothetical protein
MVLYSFSTSTWRHARDHALVFPEDRGQPANLSTKRSSDVLRLIRNKLLYAGHDVVKERLPFEQCAEACFVTLSAMFKKGEEV